MKRHPAAVDGGTTTTPLDADSNHSVPASPSGRPKNLRRKSNSKINSNSKHHHRQHQHQRTDNPFSQGSKKKCRFRFHSFAKGAILCTWFLWIGTFFLLIRRLPSTSWSTSFRTDNGNEHYQPLKLTAPHNNTNQPQDAPYTIVHSLTTRFMLGQKGQPILARARYLLFETFCHPTVRYQTALARTDGYDFSWFVLVDPGVDRSVIEDMRALLSSQASSSSSGGDVPFPDGNAYLILTDNPLWAADGVGVPNVTSYGAGFQEIARAVRDGTVELLTGNQTRLLETLDANFEGRQATARATVTANGGNDNDNDNDNDQNKPLMIIETMLDADDGLNNRAVEWIQDLAVSHTRKQQEWALRQHQKRTNNSTNSTTTTTNNNNTATGKALQPPSLNSTWWLFCGTDHIEWHNREVFRLTDKQVKERGGVSSGIVGLRLAPHYCASAGFTRVGLTMKPSATAASIDVVRNLRSEAAATTPTARSGEPPPLPLLAFPEVAYSNHALATEQFDVCNDGAGADPNITLSHCFRRSFPFQPYVLKSRSITSDSMDHMDPRRKDYRDLPWENATDHPLLGLDEPEWMWGVVRDGFSIDRNSAQITSAYLRENLAAILQENKDSRCAPGFPCRKVATLTLKRMGAQLKRLQRANRLGVALTSNQRIWHQLNNKQQQQQQQHNQKRPRIDPKRAKQQHEQVRQQLNARRQNVTKALKQDTKLSQQRKQQGVDPKNNVK
eukprot:jgi/Psemu1/56589/gm1.56589_g